MNLYRSDSDAPLVASVAKTASRSVLVVILHVAYLFTRFQALQSARDAKLRATLRHHKYYFVLFV